MKKVLLSVLALILIAWIVYAGYFFLEEKRVRDYSTACMDKVREEIWNEYLWNIALIDSEKVDGVYHYFWMCSDETSDYYFSCAVTNKDNVDVKIEVDEVPDDFDWCNHYFDGCNRCTLQDDWGFVCTEEACEEYQDAYCWDEQYNQFLEDIKSSWEQPQGKNNLIIPAFDDINKVVDKCGDDSYDYNVYQKAYILPYKDWYIWYQLWWQDGWELYLTYRKLGEPCNIISQSDNIFWWNPYYKEWQETFRWASYPDNKIYIAQWLFSWVPTEEIVKELNCIPGNNFEDHDHTCMKEADKYFYDLIVWNEENEYFTKWMNKLKEDIDNEDYKTFSFYREEYDTCSQKVVDLIWALQPNQF